MKAVVVKEGGVLEVQDVAEPEPGPDQIKVKIAYAGICGSDPKIVAGHYMPVPTAGAIGWPEKTPPRTQRRGKVFRTRSFRHDCENRQRR